jgi:hypothetical protein
MPSPTSAPPHHVGLPCSPSRKKLRRHPRRHEAAVADAREAAPSLCAPSPPRPQPQSDDAVPFCEFASPTSVVRYADDVAAPALPAAGVRLPLQRLGELADLATAAASTNEGVGRQRSSDGAVHGRGAVEFEDDGAGVALGRRAWEHTARSYPASSSSGPSACSSRPWESPRPSPGTTARRLHHRAVGQSS